jgi:hypothetical protein
MTGLSNSLQDKRNRVNISDPYKLGVDVVHPNGLDLPCTITRSFQNRPHLLHAREQVSACQEPPDALGARRSGQAALVSPELVESTCVVECQLQIQFQRLLHRRCLVPVDHRRRELLDESRVLKPRLHAYAQHCSGFALCVHMHKVEFSSGAARSYRVIGGCMYVPTSEVYGRVVVSHTGVAGVIAFFVRKRECRAKSPVVKVSLKGTAVIEARFVGKGGTMLGHQMDGCLVSAGVACFVV